MNGPCGKKTHGQKYGKVWSRGEGVVMTRPPKEHPTEKDHVSSKK